MNRKRTGIFLPYFHGQRLMDFPQALNGILDKEQISYYDGVYRFTDRAYYLKPVNEDLLLKVHTKGMIESVARTGYLEAALYSAGGSVQAADEIASPGGAALLRRCPRGRRQPGRAFAASGSLQERP